MKFKLEIECDGAAFEDANLQFEVGRILFKYGERLANSEARHDDDVLMDTNGNRVGRAYFEGD